MGPRQEKEIKREGFPAPDWLIEAMKEMKEMETEGTGRKADSR